MAKQEREVEQWITVNGVHVPVFKGQSKEEAVKGVLDKQKASKGSTGKGKSQQTQEKESKQTEEQKTISKNEDEKEQQIARNKAEADERSGRLLKPAQKERVENYKALIEKYQKQGMSLEEAKERAYGTGKTSRTADDIKREYDSIKGNSQAEASRRAQLSKELSNTVASELKVGQTYMVPRTHGQEELVLTKVESISGRSYGIFETPNGVRKNINIAGEDLYGITEKKTDSGSSKSTGFMGNSVSKAEEAYMNYKAIRISKNMPKAKQDELKRLKAQYKKEWEKLSGRK